MHHRTQASPYTRRGKTVATFPQTILAKVPPREMSDRLMTSCRLLRKALLRTVLHGHDFALIKPRHFPDDQHAEGVQLRGRFPLPPRTPCAGFLTFAENTIVLKRVPWNMAVIARKQQESPGKGDQYEHTNVAPHFVDELVVHCLPADRSSCDRGAL